MRFMFAILTQEWRLIHVVSVMFTTQLPKTFSVHSKNEMRKCWFSTWGRDRKHDSKRQIRIYIHRSHASYLFFSIRTLTAFIIDAFAVYTAFLCLQKKTAGVWVFFETVSFLSLYLFYSVLEHYIQNIMKVELEKE